MFENPPEAGHQEQEHASQARVAGAQFKSHGGYEYGRGDAYGITSSVPVAQGDSRGEARRLRRRSFPSSPELTARDVRVLRVIGEHGSVLRAVLMVLFGRLSPLRPDDGLVSLRAVRNRLSRLQQLGLIDTERMLGQVWVTLTQRGLRKVGLPFSPWPLPATRARHTHAVLLVRLALEGADPNGRWRSERWLLLDRGEAVWHVPDGLWRQPSSPDGEGAGTYAVEVELTLKTAKRYSNEVLSRLPRDLAGVRYFAPAELVDPLTNVLTRVIRERHSGLQTPVTVEALPDVPGLSYDGIGGAW